MIVCADCSVFISPQPQPTPTSPVRSELIRSKRLESLIPYLRTNSTPVSPVSLLSSSPFDNFEATPTHTTGVYQSAGKDLQVDITCSLKGNKTTKKATVLQYSMSIQCSNDKQLCLMNDLQSFQPVDIIIEGAIALTKKPEQVYGHVELIKKDPPIYESIPSLRHIQYKMSNNNLPPMREQVTTCKNGCLWRGSSADLGEHLKTCAMVKMSCFFDSCDWHGSEQLMKGHLFNKHRTYIKDQIEGKFGWQDKFMVVIQHGIIFIFKYYSYDALDYVDMMVQGVVNRNEMDYKYSIHVYSMVNGKKVKIITKSAKCMVFNKCVLQNGVRFTEQEMKEFNNCVFNVEITKML